MYAVAPALEEMRRTPTHVYFSHLGALSPWFERPFKQSFQPHGVPYEFTTRLQYYVAAKAWFFGDTAALAACMQAHTKEQIREIVSLQVLGFDAARWAEVEDSHLDRAARAFFLQNADAHYVLLATGDRKLVYATEDRHFGVGLSLTDPLVNDDANFVGQNLIGLANERCRARMRDRNVGNVDVPMRLLVEQPRVDGAVRFMGLGQTGCSVPWCDGVAPAHHLMCAAHWRQVPYDVQKIISEHFNALILTTRMPDEAYTAAVERAIEHIIDPASAQRAAPLPGYVPPAKTISQPKERFSPIPRTVRFARLGQTRCTMPSCHVETPAHHLMCAAHWSRVPRSIQAEIAGHFQRLLLTTRTPDERYEAAVERAVESLLANPKPRPQTREKFSRAVRFARLGQTNCAALRCGAQLQPQLLMCPQHWAKVPDDIKLEIQANFQRLAATTRMPDAEYDRAVANAVLAVHEARDTRRMPSASPRARGTVGARNDRRDLKPVTFSAESEQSEPIDNAETATWNAEALNELARAPLSLTSR